MHDRALAEQNKRFYSSGNDSSSSSSSSGNGKWVALALLLSGVGGVGIAYQNGLFDKGSGDKGSDRKGGAEKKKSEHQLFNSLFIVLHQ